MAEDNKFSWENVCKTCLQEHQPNQPFYYLQKNDFTKDYTLFQRNYYNENGCELHPFNLGYINWPDVPRLQKLLDIANKVLSRTKSQ